METILEEEKNSLSELMRSSIDEQIKYSKNFHSRIEPGSTTAVEARKCKSMMKRQLIDKTF